MNEVLKYLGQMLRRTYGTIVQTPMPWRMIDKLAALEESEEKNTPLPSASQKDRAEPQRRSQRD
ncbi:hypothetical protein [Hyphomicrobium sp. CS1GBMeth3]|uniref:hypothetical protein n=1 Tax=Hyphomicrobium sp. CS1GBMeth3 TaxID=1892845 RepID=UPI00092FE86C|nr:hypothetical protein [Hyphomicrobium sp. CS1GBMeth3]